MAGERSAPPGAASTLGVEEEYHVVDPETYELRDEPILGAGAIAGRLGPRIHPAVATTQLEAVTRVCHTLAHVRAELVASRTAAAEAAASVGATILVASTHPTGSWTDQRLTARPRYIELYERWGLLALQHGICGCHTWPSQSAGLARRWGGPPATGSPVSSSIRSGSSWSTRRLPWSG